MPRIILHVIVFGIETSCDETSAAVVKDGQVLLSNIVASQMEEHALYGGVVPELASRRHVEVLIPVFRQALAEAGCTWADSSRPCRGRRDPERPHSMWRPVR